MYETLEHSFANIVGYCIMAVEAVGVAILLVTAVRALVELFRDRKKSRHLLAEGITTALSFLLTSEVMNTIVAPDWKDIGMTCAILLMRAGMTVLVQWEHTHEIKEEE